MGIIIDKERLAWVENVLEEEIDPKLLNILLLGHRMLVVDQPAVKKFGMIEIPTTSQERAGGGYVLGMASGVGYGKYRSGSYECWFDENEDAQSSQEQQKDLLGRHVAYRFTAGVPVVLTMADDDYTSPIKVMHAKDILFFMNDELEFKLPVQDKE